MSRRTVALLVLAAAALTACKDVGLSPTAPRVRHLAVGRTYLFALAAPCTFDTKGHTMRLTSDCFTTASIVVPDSFTLNGNDYTITAVDPSGGHFLGAVIVNGGATANVTHVVVTAEDLADVCDGTSPVDTRLRGILFRGASGSITHSTVTGINEGASGCQEGNAIEVRNFGDNASTSVVDIAHNIVTDYQKTGIVCNGDARCDVHENTIGASATQANLAANAVQFGFGGSGSLDNNKITGNTWAGAGDDATAVLLYAATGVHVGSNKIDGSSDVGIYVYGDQNIVEKNKIDDEGAGKAEVGIGDYGIGNAITKNQVSGFDTPFDGVTGSKNRARHAPPVP